MTFFAGGLSLLIASTQAAHIQQVRDAVQLASNSTTNSSSSSTSSSSSSLSSLVTLSSSITSSSSSAFSSSSTSSVSSSEGSVANYIAQGLGLPSIQSSTIDSSTSSTSSSSDFLSSSRGTVTQSSSSAGSIVANSSIHHPVNDFISLTTASSSLANASSISASITETASLGNATSIPISSFGGNYTVNPANKTAVDICYSSWDYWWQTGHYDTSPGTPYVTVYTDTEYLETVYTTLETDTVFETLGNGAFATRTLTEIFTNTATDHTVLYNSPTGVSYDTETITPAITSPTPNCVLPSSVPQCQSSWVTYLSSLYGLPNGTDNLNAQEPSCSQADVTGTLCSQVISKRLQNIYNDGEDGNAYTYISNTETITTGGSTITSTAISSLWLSNATAAPGCTVGCQDCRISGNQVQLIYWPPATANASQTGPVTAVGLGTTFTYPTVYISFDALSASDSCSAVGTTMNNVIVAISNTATLSSIYGWGSPNGAYDGPQDSSASFNFNDLYTTPVPDSIYESQPRCSSTLFSIWQHCGSFSQYNSGLTSDLPSSICNSAYTCPRSLPYEPVVSVPSEVQGLQVAWAGCVGALRGVYDPPKALTAGVLAAEPTSLSFVSVPTSPSDPGQGTTKAAPAPTPTSPVGPTTPASGASPTGNPGAGGSSSSNNNNGGSGSNNGGSSSNDGDSSNKGGNGSGQSGQGVAGSQNQQSGQIGNPSPGSSGGSSGEQGGSSSSGSGQNGGTGSQAGSSGSGQSGQGAGQSKGQSGSSQASGQQESSNGAPGSGGQSNQNGAEGGQSSQNGAEGGQSNQNGAAAGSPGSGSSGSGSQGDPGVAAGSGAAATFQGAGGAVISAQSQGSNVIIAAPGTTATIASGQSATIGGLTIANKGNGIAVDGSSVAVPAAAAASPSSGASSGAVSAFTLPNGDSVTAQAQGSNIVAHAGSSSVTLTPGGTAVINGQTLSAPSAGGAIVAGGSTHSLPTAGPSRAAAGAIFTGQDGQVFTVSTESNGNIDVMGKSTTAVLTPGGSASVVDGKTLSAKSSGGGLIVDGSNVGSATASSTASGTIVPARSSAISTHSSSGRGLAMSIVIGGMAILLRMAI